MNYTEVKNWWDEKFSEDALENQALARLGTYLDAADAVPEKFRLQTLSSLLFRDKMAYSMLMKDNPSWRTEMQKLIYGRPWDWGADQVALVLGFKDPAEMFKRENVKKGKGDPAWQKLLGDERDPEKASKALDEYYLEEEGVEPGKMYKWLQTEQANYDREKKYNQPGYKLYSLISPRQVEAWKAGKEASNKDVILDMAENVAQAIPYGRIALGIKGAAKSLPKVIHAVNPNTARAAKGVKDAEAVRRFIYSHPDFIKTAYGVGQAAATPVAMEVADALAYTPEENLERSTFNAGDVAGGTATNLVAPMVVGSLVKRIGGRSGLYGGTRDEIANALGATDPYINMLVDRKAYKYGGSAPSNADIFWSNKEGQAKILDEVQKAMKEYEKSGKHASDVDAWRKTKAPSEKRKAVLKNLEIPGEPTLSDDFIHAFENNNPNAISESQALIATGRGKKIGIDTKGNPVFIKEDFDPSGVINPRHGIDMPTAGPERSIESLNRAEKEAMKLRGIDADYPGNVYGTDVHIRKAAKDPVVQSIRAGSKAGLAGQMAKNYIGNKLGQEKMGQGFVSGVASVVPVMPKPEEYDYLGVDPDVVALLKDPTTVRIWEAGFVPRKIEGDPTWEAYQLWQKIKKE